MEWKYGKSEGQQLPPGIEMMEGEKFSMREFGNWTVNGFVKLSKTGDILDSGDGSRKSAKIIID